MVRVSCWWPTETGDGVDPTRPPWVGSGARAAALAEDTRGEADWGVDYSKAVLVLERHIEKERSGLLTQSYKGVTPRAAAAISRPEQEWLAGRRRQRKMTREAGPWAAGPSELQNSPAFKTPLP